MKKLFAFLGKRWFLTLLGACAVAFIIWFASPWILLDESTTLDEHPWRWLVYVAPFIIWLLAQIVIAAVARIRNRRMMTRLADAEKPEPDAAEAASAEEVETLGRRFDEAMEVLKKADIKHRLGGLYVYQLPWYLIIGPPGCGKTTALVNSGLRFPLADRGFGQDPIRGVGGTRNCDWWFTDQAVLLDTAGRYTTQDSYEVVDSAAWLGFLGLLKKHRPRRPVNGVLVAVSLADLMEQSETERAVHARAIKQRVQELHQHLGIRFPIYVVFMKADLIAGFMEFYADLGKEDRAQVWGMTFAMDETTGASPGLDAFPAELDLLEDRAGKRLLPRLQEERDAQKRALIYAFPQQFRSLRETAHRFLQDVFQPSRYEQNPLVRGVYFTSGTQTGAPIDRVMNSLAANLGLEGQVVSAFSGHGKSFFITRLLRDLIFVEAGLAGTNLRLERHRRWVQRGAYAAAIGVALLAGTAWLTSFTQNRGYIAEVGAQTDAIEAQIEGLEPQGKEPLRFLPMLNAMRDMRGGHDDPVVPLTERFGLSQHGKLGAAARDAYRKMLEETLLSAVILRLEDQIRDFFSEPDRLYESLRVYLMLYDDAHYDAETVRAWATAYWEHNWPRRIPVEQRTQLNAHLEALFRDTPPTYRPHEIDAVLVARAREIINRTSPAERVFDRLQQTGVGDAFSDFSLSRAVGHYADLVFKRKSGMNLSLGIPALYTYDAYHKGFGRQTLKRIQELLDERWILGSSVPLGEAAGLLEEVRGLYLREYVEQWQDLLADLVIADARDPREAAAILSLLSDKRDSPLLRLLEAVARETNLEHKAEGENGIVDKAEELVDKSVSRVSKLWKQVEPTPFRKERPPEHVVTDAFSEIHALVDAEEGQVPPIESVLDQLHPLAVYMNNYADRVGKGPRLLDFVKQDSAEAESVIRLAESLPAPLGGWLETVAADSANMVSGETRAELNRLWKADVLPFCRRATHNRYPFQPGSAAETPLKDFGQLFGANGDLDRFFQENFAAAVDTTTDPWRWVGEGDGISGEALTQFQLAAAIRESFFGGGAELAVEFKLSAIGMDTQAKQFLLDLEGQNVIYKHEAGRAWTLHWPVPEGTGRVRINFVNVAGNEFSVTEHGPWAWFRILDRSTLNRVSDELYRVTFLLSGLGVTFDLDALSVRNPFGLTELRNFRCPERL
jgi:type VI secretion system protein ImpL